MTLRSIGTALHASAGALPQLEALLRRRYAAERAVLFGSGTQALTAAILTTLVTERDANARIVALPAYACYDLVSAAVGADVRVLLYDVDPLTLGPDWDSLERAFVRGARSAVMVALYGVPIDWQRAEEVAAPHGALLIEDAAQGAGAEWNGRPLGALGRISVLSFGRGKGWTGGSGGALLLRDASFRVTDPAPPPGRKRASNVAGIAAQWFMGRPTWYGVPYALPFLHLGETRYHPPAALSGLDAFAAALLLQTEQSARAEAPLRRQTASRWLHGIAGILAADPDAAPPAVTPLPTALPASAQPGYLRLPVLLHEGASARLDLGALGRAGVERGYPTTLLEVPQLRARLAEATEALPGAAALSSRLITLPTHSWVTLQDHASVLSQLRLARP